MNVDLKIAIEKVIEQGVIERGRIAYDLWQAIKQLRETYQVIYEVEIGEVEP